MFGHLAVARHCALTARDGNVMTARYSCFSYPDGLTASVYDRVVHHTSSEK